MASWESKFYPNFCITGAVRGGGAINELCKMTEIKRFCTAAGERGGGGAWREDSISAQQEFISGLSGGSTAYVYFSVSKEMPAYV